MLQRAVSGARNERVARLGKMLVALAPVGLFADGAAAVLLDALDPAVQWKVERTEFSGNNTVATGELSDVI